jgi:hypothetical protein
MWTTEKFFASRHGKAMVLDGWTFEGLGLHRMLNKLPDVPMPSIWALYHLNSGHVVVFIMADEDIAFEIGMRIAKLGDWSFDGLDGWKNIEPDLRQKLHLLAKENSDKIFRFNGLSNEETAQKVFRARNDPNSVGGLRSNSNPTGKPRKKL